MIEYYRAELPLVRKIIYIKYDEYGQFTRISVDAMENSCLVEGDKLTSAEWAQFKIANGSLLDPISKKLWDYQLLLTYGFI